MVCRTIFMRTRLLLIASVWATWTADAQITEGFETGYTAGATQFAGPDGALFTLTSDLRITNFASFGANGSNWFLDTGVLEGNDNTPPSQIILADEDQTFTLIGLMAWTSNDDGDTYADGTLTLTGASLNGPVSHTFMVEPTGNSGFDWVQLDPDGTPLEGAALRSLTVTYGSTLNYVALDQIAYRLQPITSVAERSPLDDVRLFPVPTRGEVNLDLRPVTGTLLIRVRDALGREVARLTATGGAVLAFPLHTLVAGRYLLEMEAANGVRRTWPIAKDG